MPFLSSHAKVIAFTQFLDSTQNYGVDDCTLTPQGVVADVYGNKIVWPGTTIAKVTGTHLPTYGKCIVRVTAPTYGPGSDVAVGILRNIADLTYGDQNVALVTNGHVRQAYITDVGTVGTVAAATKTALPHIQWH
jgi:hypothetical protein